MDRDQELLNRITFRPEIIGGKPIVGDMRIAIEHVSGTLATGESEKTILSEHRCSQPNTPAYEL